MNEKKKQSPERLEYLRNYRKNHKEQQKIYQKRYIEKLRQQGKFPITTSMKLRKQLEAYENMRKEAIECLNNFSVDKSFSFPLMKRWEENQVKSSIDYEFNDTLKKDLLNILNKIGEDNE